MVCFCNNFCFCYNYNFLCRRIGYIDINMFLIDSCYFCCCTSCIAVFEIVSILKVVIIIPSKSDSVKYTQAIATLTQQVSNIIK